MALLKSKYSELPSDAIVLSEEEALSYQTKIMRNWKNSRDIFAFKTGAYVLGGASFLCGLYINNFYRNKLHLYHYGRVSSYLPICVIPAALSVVTHLEFILKDVLLQRQGNCPICIQMRASAIQSFVGCAMPAVLGPLSSMALAHKYATYDLPFITSEPRKLFQTLRKITNPIANLLLAMFIGQALLASAVVYLEEDSVYRVNLKLAVLEHELVTAAGDQA